MTCWRATFVATAMLAAGCRPGSVAPEATPAVLELTSQIRQAGGRVLIGFKEANAARGVDIRGAILVSDATQARAKAYLRDQGVEIVQAFMLIPAVRAKIEVSPALVARLRANPNIDYIEPVEFGAFLDSGGLRGR